MASLVRGLPGWGPAALGGSSWMVSCIAAPLRRAVQRISSTSALLALTAVPTLAATYYIDGANPSASDLNPGTAALPFKTISGAMSAHAGAGVTLIVKPARYPEQVSVL